MPQSIVGWLSLIIFTELLVACESFTKVVELNDTEWELISLNGQSPIEGTSITLRFDESKLSGLAGCNTYTAEYETTEAGEIIIPEVARTTEDCETPEGIMEQEGSYLEMLWTGAGYEVTNGKLEIRNEEGETTVIFGRKQGA